MRLSAVNMFVLILSLAGAACSPSKPNTEQGDGGSTSSDAGASHDAGDRPFASDNRLHVAVTNDHHAGSQPLAHATILVEQNGEVISMARSGDDGRWSAEVDWDDGPLTVTAWRYGFSVASVVGVTQDLVPEGGVPLELYALYLPQDVRIQTYLRPITSPGHFLDVSVFSNSDLATRSDDNSVWAWVLNTERGVPLEIAYYVYEATVVEGGWKPPEPGSGYQAYSFPRRNWWRISLPSPVDDLVFDEMSPASEMREIKPRPFQIALPVSPSGEPCEVTARVSMRTAQGPLVIGTSFEGYYSGGLFVMTVATTDEIAGADEVYTELVRTTPDVAPGTSSVIRLEGAGKTRELSDVEWLPLPAMTNVDAKGIAWASAKSAHTQVFVAPSDRSAGQWSIFAMAGVSELTWPTLPEEVEPVFRGEVGAFLRSCERRADGDCDRRAKGESFAVPRGP